VVEGQSIDCYVLCIIDKESIEIKNIVVDEKHQGKGIRTILLNDAIKNSKVKRTEKDSYWYRMLKHRTTLSFFIKK
jgi:GNAT superfamily N-acetyltransferase